MSFPSEEQIDKAATRWCGEKDRETFYEDILYFKNYWKYLPGLTKYVEEVIREDN